MEIVDIETNGLYFDVKTVHCVVSYNTETKQERVSFGDQIEDHLRYLQTQVLCGHNVLAYDIPVLQKLYPWFSPDLSKVRDTLVLSRLMYPKERTTLSDFKLVKQKKLPSNLVASHSLEAWGHRLGEHKGEFAGPWDVFTPEMLEYCRQDVQVTVKLAEKLLSEEYSAQAIELEHQVQVIIQRQIRRGVAFNATAATNLYLELASARDKIEAELKPLFGFWYAPKKLGETFTPKRDNDAHGYVEGVPFTPVKTVDFNPGSRAHILHVLTKRYGWVPEVFTEKGNPKIDDEVLAGLLHFPPVEKLRQYLVVKKLIGTIAEGDKAWLKLERKGRLHGGVNSGGAVTGRMTHSEPNLANVPGVKKEKQKQADGTMKEVILMGLAGGWGYEARDFFVAPKGHSLVGCDAAGLELRCLAHFMSYIDGGAYAKVIVEGDIHATNQEAAGLPNRPAAKKFAYTLLYGGGDALLGAVIGQGAAAGAMMKAKFLKALPALAKLKEAVEEAAKRGYLVGIDGRKVYIREAHAALNTLLQSAGAVIMKKALVLLDQALQARGMEPGFHYEFVLNVHDEFQIEVLDGPSARGGIPRATCIGIMAECAIVEAGEAFKFRCPLAGEYKVGKTWAQTH